MMPSFQSDIDTVIRIDLYLNLALVVTTQIILYSRKLSREKLLQIGEKYDVRGENFCGLFAFAAPKDATLPNFTEKTFANSHKTVKFSTSKVSRYMV